MALTRVFRSAGENGPALRGFPEKIYNPMQAHISVIFCIKR